MITPEPTEIRHVVHADIDCSAGRHAWCTPAVSTVPAAGHLGVIEEKCGDKSDEFHGRQFATEFGMKNPCPFCRAAL